MISVAQTPQYFSKVWVVLILGKAPPVCEVFSNFAGPDGAQEFALEHVNDRRRVAGLPDEENPFRWAEALKECSPSDSADPDEDGDDDDKVVILIRERDVRIPIDHY